MSTPAAPSAEQRKVVVVDGTSPTLDILNWPLRDEPAACSIVLCVIAVLSVAAGLMGDSLWWGVAAFAALLLSLWRMWIPVHFRLCEIGVIQTALRRSWRLPWESLSGFQMRNDGVLLLPDDDSFLGRMQGIYIAWGEQREEMLELLEHYFGSDSP